MTRLQPPRIIRSETALRSEDFDDIYYQEADGLAESRHVFIEGNDLQQRLASDEGYRPFVIAELGFGTGLNLLAAIDAFQQYAPSQSRLSLWSVEGFPLSPEQLRDIHESMVARWPELQSAIDLLGSVYPPTRPGQFRLSLSPRISLTLAFGSALEALSAAEFKADAWFLDGFSPATNPDMWSPELMREVAQHTSSSGTFATFTVAGTVRRGLSAAGFSLERRPGFGRKREMLTGKLDSAAIPAEQGRKRIAVIGAGIAGAAVAWHLKQAGQDVHIFERQKPAAGASGNPAGLIMPRLEAADNPQAHFYRNAYLYAQHFYDRYAGDALVRYEGELRDEQRRLEKVQQTALWSEEDFILHKNILQIPKAALLQPQMAVESLLRDIPVILQDVQNIDQVSDGKFRLTDAVEHSLFDHVVICAGPHTARLAGLMNDMAASRGQIDWFRHPTARQIITSGTYIAPWKGGVLAGATYDKAQPDDNLLISKQSSLANRNAAEELTGQATGSLVGSRVSLRATTTDRHPIMGELPWNPGLFALTGLGSRGLVTAPLLGAQITAEIIGDIRPLPIIVRNILYPERFEQRRKRRGQ